eukprot:gene8312-8497_t
MAATAVRNKNVISLKGSAVLVAEYFNYAVNSILYQRGIYPPESFEQRDKYGMSIWATKEEGLRQYLSTVCSQMKVWLEEGTLQRLVLVVSRAIGDKAVLERWTFQVDTDQDVVSGRVKEVDKPTEAIKKEIQAIIRQIFASVTFLPLLEDPCTFDLLVYTSKDSATVPQDWCDSDPCYITNGEEVKLRTFTTKVSILSAHPVLPSAKTIEQLLINTTAALQTACGTK